MTEWDTYIEMSQEERHRAYRTLLPKDEDEAKAATVRHIAIGCRNLQIAVDVHETWLRLTPRFRSLRPDTPIGEIAAFLLDWGKLMRKVDDLETSSQKLIDGPLPSPHSPADLAEIRARLDQIDRGLDAYRHLYQTAHARAQTQRAAVRAERLSRNQASAPEPSGPTCAIPGCTKRRAFFDTDGTGYCKRHGNERGLRPHGKVT